MLLLLLLPGRCCSAGAGAVHSSRERDIRAAVRWRGRARARRCTHVCEEGSGARTLGDEGTTSSHGARPASTYLVFAGANVACFKSHSSTSASAVARSISRPNLESSDAMYLLIKSSRSAIESPSAVASGTSRSICSRAHFSWLDCASGVYLLSLKRLPRTRTQGETECVRTCRLQCANAALDVVAAAAHELKEKPASSSSARIAAHP